MPAPVWSRLEFGRISTVRSPVLSGHAYGVDVVVVVELGGGVVVVVVSPAKLMLTETRAPTDIARATGIRRVLMDFLLRREQRSGKQRRCLRPGSRGTRASPVATIRSAVQTVSTCDGP